ncbi:hypothetical protein AGMMS49949_01590 [Alphaproteobacteria bacterium]|nr:hypothetical protein AGMMS49949_01590 [Alphaproteobacteria bacterium]GHS95917.1 hypothetical protein AGMMS50296_1430 [Alphaproteobacteria bacterium]
MKKFWLLGLFAGLLVGKQEVAVGSINFAKIEKAVQALNSDDPVLRGMALASVITYDAATLKLIETLDGINPTEGSAQEGTELVANHLDGLQLQIQNKNILSWAASQR